MNMLHEIFPQLVQPCVRTTFRVVFAFASDGILIAQHPLAIPRDRVDFQIDLLAGRQMLERGHRNRVRDQIDAELRAIGEIFHAVDGQANAIDRDRTLVRQIPAQRLRCKYAELPGFPHRLEAHHFPQPVDMARNDVPAKLIANAQRFFQIDFARLIQTARQAQAFARDVHGKSASVF